MPIPHRDAFAFGTPHGHPTGTKAEKEDEAVQACAPTPADLLDPDDRDWLARAIVPTPADDTAEATAERLVRLVEEKLQDETTAKRFERDPDYLERMRLFVRAGHPKAERLCACGFRGDFGGYSIVRRCNVNNFCPVCSGIRGDRALLANLAAYHRAGETAMLTLSFHGHAQAGHAADPETVTKLWALATDVIRHGIKHRLFTGAWVARELAVESLVPLRVMAHAHAIIVSPQLNVDDLKHALVNEIKKVEGALFHHARVRPQVHVAHHRDEGDMYRAITYGLKPFGCSPGNQKPGLTDLYRNAREHHRPYAVNDSIRELVHLYFQTTHKKHRASALGVLSHAAKESLRVPRKKQCRPKNLKVVEVAKLKARRSRTWEQIQASEQALEADDQA